MGEIGITIDAPLGPKPVTDEYMIPIRYGNSRLKCAAELAVISRMETELRAKDKKADELLRRSNALEHRLRTANDKIKGLEAQLQESKGKHNVCIETLAETQAREKRIEAEIARIMRDRDALMAAQTTILDSLRSERDAARTHQAQLEQKIKDQATDLNKKMAGYLANQAAIHKQRIAELDKRIAEAERHAVEVETRSNVTVATMQHERDNANNRAAAAAQARDEARTHAMAATTALRNAETQVQEAIDGRVTAEAARRQIHDAMVRNKAEYEQWRKDIDAERMRANAAAQRQVEDAQAREDNITNRATENLVYTQETVRKHETRIAELEQQLAEATKRQGELQTAAERAERDVAEAAVREARLRDDLASVRALAARSASQAEHAENNDTIVTQAQREAALANDMAQRAKAARDVAQEARRIAESDAQAARQAQQKAEREAADAATAANACNEASAQAIRERDAAQARERELREQLAKATADARAAGVAHTAEIAEITNALNTAKKQAAAASEASKVHDRNAAAAKAQAAEANQRATEANQRAAEANQRAAAAEQRAAEATKVANNATAQAETAKQQAAEVMQRAMAKGQQADAKRSEADRAITDARAQVAAAEAQVREATAAADRARADAAAASAANRAQLEAAEEGATAARAQALAAQGAAADAAAQLEAAQRAHAEAIAKLQAEVATARQATRDLRNSNLAKNSGVVQSAQQAAARDAALAQAQQVHEATLIKFQETAKRSHEEAAEANRRATKAEAELRICQDREEALQKDLNTRVTNHTATAEQWRKELVEARQRAEAAEARARTAESTNLSVSSASIAAKQRADAAEAAQRAAEAALQAAEAAQRAAVEDATRRTAAAEARVAAAVADKQRVEAQHAAAVASAAAADARAAEAAEARVAEATRTAAAAAEDLRKCQEALAQMQQAHDTEMTTLRGQVAAAEAARAKSSAELAELNEHHQRLMAVNNQTTAAQDARRNQMTAEHTARVAELESQLAARVAQLMTNTAEIARLTAANEALNGEIVRLENDLNGERAKSAALERQIADLKKQLSDCSAALTECTAARTRLEAEHKTTIDRLNDELEKEKDHSNKLIGEIKQARDECAATNDKQRAALLKRISELEAELADSRSRISDLERETQSGPSADVRLASAVAENSEYELYGTVTATGEHTHKFIVLANQLVHERDISSRAFTLYISNIRIPHNDKPHTWDELNKFVNDMTNIIREQTSSSKNAFKDAQWKYINSFLIQKKWPVVKIWAPDPIYPLTRPSPPSSQSTHWMGSRSGSRSDPQGEMLGLDNQIRATGQGEASTTSGAELLAMMVVAVIALIVFAGKTVVGQLRAWSGLLQPVDAHGAAGPSDLHATQT